MQPLFMKFVDVGSPPLNLQHYVYRQFFT